eukprot:jgi/Tetstr1/421858/TSEL_012758.t1
MRARTAEQLHGFLVGVLKQRQKRAGGIIKHNTNVVKNLAAMQAFPSDNIDEGSSPEPPAKKAKQPAKPAVGVPGRCWGHGGRRGSSHSLRKGAAFVANAIGVPLSHIRHQGGWATNSDVIMDYIEPNVLPSSGA